MWVPLFEMSSRLADQLPSRDLQPSVNDTTIRFSTRPTMGVIGVSLIVASFVCVFVCPRDWLPEWIARFRRGLGGAIEGRPPVPRKDELRRKDDDAGAHQENGSATTSAREHANGSLVKSRKAEDNASMRPPPPPTIRPPTIEEPSESEEQTTPKATASDPVQSVPSFSISEEGAYDTESVMSQPFKVERKAPSPSSSRPPSASAWASTMPAPPRPSETQATSNMAPPPRPSQAASSMAPPPRPSQAPPSLSPPTLSTPPQFAGPNSVQRARGPVPNRAPNAPSSSGLAPPPTHSTKPAKPSRKVLLQPGRSPLDWARISGPNADLRNVPASTPYLKVTPSMLKKQTGRKGKDAWMALNGRVYNITPYAEYHPGGIPELMRGAGRDGTQLFGEIHPWVNYENMLSACLVGLLVAEPEGGKSEMDEMD